MTTELFSAEQISALKELGVDVRQVGKENQVMTNVRADAAYDSLREMRHGISELFRMAKKSVEEIP